MSAITRVPFSEIAIRGGGLRSGISTTMAGWMLCSRA